MDDIPGAAWLAAFAVCVLLFLTLMGSAIYFFVKVLRMNTGGGWLKLGQRYVIREQPKDLKLYSHQTIQVGCTVILQVAEVGVGPCGLYLKCPWRKRLLIPWSDISAVGRTMLHWNPAVKLAVGEPVAAMVTLKGPLGESVFPYLPRIRSKIDAVVSGRAAFDRGSW